MASTIYTPGLDVLGKPDLPGGYVAVPESGPILGTFGQRQGTA